MFCYHCLFLYACLMVILQQSLIKTTIVPNIKRNGDLSSGNNCRPIALTNATSKVIESLYILLRCEQFLTTADNQFGLKSRHSTDFCIYT